MVEWKTPSVKDIAKRSGLKVYDVIKEIEVCKGGVVPLVFKRPKLELKKKQTIFRMIKNLPCTLSVLSRKVELPKPTLKRYLDKLISIDTVRKEFDNRCEMDIYYLSDAYISRRCPIKDVWDRWVSYLPEYQTPSISNPNPRGSAVKLRIRGHKIGEINRAKAEQRKIKKFLRKKP